ncbi:unnamed protein product [Notodromas monacha]|uniref:Golgi SNAP receptor complex member 2 n=1 Tax=Notodromas monacha TaxID=399045 RepID=A0A7R9BR58_9CRUS|nr:unnamed protein product [Notodromas monacha]CAG0920177.1 unnamed protein product [Notodromas monacha]
MEALYHQTNQLAEHTQHRLGVLERSVGKESLEIENEIQANIESIRKNCERLDVLVQKEIPARRSTSKMRVDQLIYDSKHLEASSIVCGVKIIETLTAALRNVRTRRENRERELRDREELLGTRFRTNDHGDTSIMIDHALQHHTSLQNAHRGMDDLIGSGTSILESLRDQRSSLKGVQRKLLDLANTLGLSNSVIRMIERRAYEDKYILFGGMFATSVIIFLIWKYFG